MTGAPPSTQALQTQPLEPSNAVWEGATCHPIRKRRQVSNSTDRSGTQKDVARKGSPATSPGVVRLSVNLTPDVADALKTTSSRQGVTATEGIRRAVVLWKLVDDETRKGNRLAVVEGEGEKRQYREIIIL